MVQYKFILITNRKQLSGQKNEWIRRKRKGEKKTKENIVAKLHHFIYIQAGLVLCQGYLPEKCSANRTQIPI
jgi:hypothetical protein